MLRVHYNDNFLFEVHPYVQTTSALKLIKFHMEHSWIGELKIAEMVVVRQQKLAAVPI